MSANTDSSGTPNSPATPGELHPDKHPAAGYWEFDVATRNVRWSKGLARLFGFPDGVEPDIDRALAAVHPGDVTRVYDQLQASARSGRDYALEARIKRTDGSWRKIKNVSVCIRNKRGDVATISGNVLDITDIEPRDELAGLDDAHYRLLAENATEIILELSLDGTISYVTPACRSVLGYEPCEILGHRTLEFIHPADAQVVNKLVSQLIEEGPSAGPLPIQYRSMHKDGHWVWLEGQPRVIFDPETKKPLSLQDVLRDVTARREAEDRLKESEERYRILTEQSKDIVVRIRADGTTLYVSPGCRMMGYEPEELIGKTGQSLVHPDDLASFIANGLELRDGAQFDGERKREHRFRCKNGDWVWLQGNPSALRDENGIAIEFLNVLRDVTERRNAEVALAEAKRAAEDAAATKSEFLANMSHELRTPLTSIIGFSQLLKSQPDLGPQSARFAERLVQASQALLSIVNDVLDFSKLEAGLVEINRVPASVRIIATEVLELFVPQAEAKAVALNLEFDHDLPDSLSVDEGRLRQILLNLIGNAVKFTDNGSVTLKTGFADGCLRVDVRDTGPGMPDDQFDKLFRRFSQIDTSSRRSHGGTGLGLAICKGLVDAMDGRIWAASRLGEGSTFSIEIPSVIEHPAGQSTVPDRVFSSFADLRILAADDNAANRALITAMLQPLGVALSLAPNGQEAVLLAEGHLFDVILMDLHMPGMNGYDAAKAIRAGVGVNSATPILAFTADGTLRQESGDAVFSGIVSKPVVPAALLAAITGVVTGAANTLMKTG